jgi:hypothetical protein
VYSSFDLNSGFLTEFNYRFKSDGLGLVAGRIFKTPFSNYMDGAEHSRGWGLIENVGRALGLKVNTNELRERYKDTKRVLVTL